MSVSSTIAAVVVAALSVIGLMAVAHALMNVLWYPREVTVAVVLTKGAGMPTPEVLDMYLAEAIRHPARRRGRAPMVLVAASLLPPGREPDEEVEWVLERYGAVLLPVEDAYLE